MTRTIIQLYRGTTAQNDAFTGSAGELSFDTTTNQVRVHDGTTVGGHIIGSGGGYHPELLSHEWDDHERNDMNWVNALTFSWQNRADHQVAYDELASNISGKTLQSETISGTTVQFYLADNGRKICPDSQESNVAAIYTATGVAWYYILDTVNQRFKLPRIDSSKEKINPALAADGQLKIVSENAIRGLKNGYGSGEYAANRSIVRTDSTPANENQPISYSSGIVLSSEQTANNNGKKYLYFYVGNFTQTALENTAGLNASLFNGKADIDASNFNSTGKETIIGWGMPSNSNYDTLTLGASGTQYTAPADGYFFLYAQYSSGSDTSYDMWVVGTGLGYRHWFGTSNVQGAGRGFVPVKKGQKIQIDINGTLGYYDFKFVYADGE